MKTIPNVVTKRSGDAGHISYCPSLNTRQKNDRLKSVLNKDAVGEYGI